MQSIHATLHDLELHVSTRKCSSAWLLSNDSLPVIVSIFLRTIVPLANVNWSLPFEISVTFTSACCFIYHLCQQSCTTLISGTQICLHHYCWQVHVLQVLLIPLKLVADSAWCFVLRPKKLRFPEFFNSLCWTLVFCGMHEVGLLCCELLCWC